MSYRKAEQILPSEIITLIQQYVDGECIYIPRKENTRKAWGEGTRIREELQIRNHNIYVDFKQGFSILELTRKYYLSEKSIQRIIRKMKSAA